MNYKCIGIRSSEYEEKKYNYAILIEKADIGYNYMGEARIPDGIPIPDDESFKTDKIYANCVLKSYNNRYSLQVTDFVTKKGENK